MRQLVFLLHGIRTQAEWVTRAASILDERPGTRTIPIRYEYFDILRFLLPVPFIRNHPVGILAREIHAELLALEPAEVCIVAHSFGTYIVSKLLITYPYIKIRRLIFCGAVVNDAYDWRRVAHQIGDSDGSHWRAINDCGMKDIMPVLAKAVTWGYGSSGRFGFGSGVVKDRFFELGHSGFFSDEFIRTYWVPYLEDGTIVKGTLDRGTTPWWVSLLTLLTVPNLVYGAIVGGIVFLLATLLRTETPDDTTGPAATAAPAAKGEQFAQTTQRDGSAQVDSSSFDILSNGKAWRVRTRAQYRALSDGIWGADGGHVDFVTSLADIGKGVLRVTFDNTTVSTITFWSQGDINSPDEESRENCNSSVWPVAKGDLIKRYGEPTSFSDKELGGIEGDDKNNQMVVSTLYSFEIDEPLVAECAKDTTKCAMGLYTKPALGYVRYIYTFKATDGTIVKVNRWQVNYSIETREAVPRRSSVRKCALGIEFK